MTKKPDTSLDAILKERGDKYGPFVVHAKVTQSLMRVLLETLNENPRFLSLGFQEQAVIVESMHMIAHKLGRIVNGEPTYDDSWDDIAGYAKLVSKHISTLSPL